MGLTSACHQHIFCHAAGNVTNGVIYGFALLSLTSSVSGVDTVYWCDETTSNGLSKWTKQAAASSFTLAWSMRTVPCRSVAAQQASCFVIAAVTLMNCVSSGLTPRLCGSLCICRMRTA
jgi:hypothetical protein